MGMLTGIQLKDTENVVLEFAVPKRTIETDLLMIFSCVYLVFAFACPINTNCKL